MFKALKKEIQGWQYGVSSWQADIIVPLLFSAFVFGLIGLSFWIFY